MRETFRFAAVVWLTLGCGSARAGLDLRNVAVERLDNGLTVMLLEDRNFPVVSVQMLYRVGARDESYGHTGIAHFLEHMAFRGSENFPDTGLVSAIYAVGGEWHGYTWTDQTTYFATVPKEHLDLLLRIEADRMSRLDILADDMEAERGAVLAEMHMYENHPSSMLLDALMFASFQAHPYRNNTIGWESDIEALAHADVVAFHKRHYQPANAVLAVVGDFDMSETAARIAELFAGFDGRPPTLLPHTVEPLQQGERRVHLHAHTDLKRFRIGWRAPSASHPDFAAFLVLQEVLGKGSGVNFRQNDWGTPVDENALLHGAAEDVTTWFPPSAQDYLFVIGGSAGTDADEATVEESVEERVASLRETTIDSRVLADALEDVLDELVFDVATTEDAAHQLAFFDGLGALDTLLELPGRVSAVTAADVQRVARRWLLPQRRTIVWHVPGEAGNAALTVPVGEPKIIQLEPAGPVDRTPNPGPVVRELRGGIPAIVQPSDFSPAAYLQIVLPGRISAADATANHPVPGYSSLAYRLRPRDLVETVTRAREAVAAAAPAADSQAVGSPDPGTRLEQTFLDIMIGGQSPVQKAARPALIVVSGDVDVSETFAVLERQFGDMAAPETAVPRRPFAGGDIDIELDAPVAQAQLGYIVPAPGAHDADSYVWQLLLYVLSHDYEGRLGKEAISRRGLAYYIDSRYRSDGENGWITLGVGVDPHKLAELKALMLDELRRLREDPPTEAEITEAKAHLVGRARSAAQSNEELADALGKSWIWYNSVPSPERLEAVLASIERRDVLDAVVGFVGGSIVTVRD